MIITANCKLNLTMEVLGRRDDGYHNIRSVMQFLDLGDLLEVEPADSFTFWCDDATLCGEDNLAVRAYRLLASQYTLQPLSIRLYKKTPCMSGMGGGSADAAAVLRAVNTTSLLGLSTEQLCALGKTIGADVPACVVGGLLLAEGIGERITPLDSGRQMWFCIVKPQCAFSTPAMYSRLDSEAGFAPERHQQELLSAVQLGNVQGAARWFVNTFEQVAEPFEAIAAAKQLLLDSGAAGASMTGAGSAVFGIYTDEAAASAAHKIIAGTGAQVYLCHSVGRYQCLD